MSAGEGRGAGAKDDGSDVDDGQLSQEQGSDFDDVDNPLFTPKKKIKLEEQSDHEGGLAPELSGSIACVGRRDVESVVGSPNQQQNAAQGCQGGAASPKAEAEAQVTLPPIGLKGGKGGKRKRGIQEGQGKRSVRAEEVQ